jgi:hypothetical protein
MATFQAHIASPPAPEPNSSRPTRFKREKAEEEFTLWQRYMRDLASAENIVVKIGGLGMLTFGFDSHRQPTPPDSSDLQRK